MEIDGSVEATPEQCDILDVPLRPASRLLRLRFPKVSTSACTFVLRRLFDGFEQTRLHDEDIVPGDDYVDLEFPGVIDGLAYTLELCFDDHKRRVLFANKTIHQLLQKKNA